MGMSLDPEADLCIDLFGMSKLKSSDKESSKNALEIIEICNFTQEHESSWKIAVLGPAQRGKTSLIRELIGSNDIIFHAPGEPTVLPWSYQTFNEPSPEWNQQDALYATTLFFN